MTEKKLKQHLHRIWFHYYRLRDALNDAHHAGVIDYPGGEYRDKAPCYAADLLRERVVNTTAKAIADTVTEEIRSKIR